MATEPALDQSLQGPAAWEEEASREHVHGVGPWKLGLRRLRRNKVALLFGLLFVLLVLCCLAAPLWAKHVAKTGPNENHLTDTIVLDGKKTNVVSSRRNPDRPHLAGEYFFGADKNGRDIMVRLLYGGRNSLLIGITAALMTTRALHRPGHRSRASSAGATDTVIRAVLDIMWSFPVVILGVALGVALALGGLQTRTGQRSPATRSSYRSSSSGSSICPTWPGPCGGRCCRCARRSSWRLPGPKAPVPLRIMVGEVVPNLLSTLLVFFTLLIANAILLESALSFLGAGVRPPEPSWGTMIDEGVDRIATAPHLTVIPGLMLVLTVLSLNVFGDGVRDALDPRAKVRLEH